MSDDELTARIGLLLLGVGRGSEVSSAEISRRVGIPDVPGQPATRELIAQAVRRFKLPIGANERGYFLIETPSELETYIGELKSRANAILSRAEAVERAFLAHQSGDPL